MLTPSWSCLCSDVGCCQLSFDFDRLGLVRLLQIQLPHSQLQERIYCSVQPCFGSQCDCEAIQKNNSTRCRIAVWGEVFSLRDQLLKNVLRPVGNWQQGWRDGGLARRDNCWRECLEQAGDRFRYTGLLKKSWRDFKNCLHKSWEIKLSTFSA